MLNSERWCATTVTSWRWYEKYPHKHRYVHTQVFGGTDSKHLPPVMPRTHKLKHFAAHSTANLACLCFIYVYIKYRVVLLRMHRFLTITYDAYDKVLSSKTSHWYTKVQQRISQHVTLLYINSERYSISSKEVQVSPFTHPVYTLWTLLCFTVATLVNLQLPAVALQFYSLLSTTPLCNSAFANAPPHTRKRPPPTPSEHKRFWGAHMYVQVWFVLHALQSVYGRQLQPGTACHHTIMVR